MIIISSTGLIIILLYLFGWISPLFKKYSQINDNLSQISIQLEKYQILLSNKDECRKKILVIENKLKKTKDKVYLSETPLIATSQMLNNLEAISKETKVNVISKNMVEAKKIGKYYQIAVMFNLQSTPESLTTFLYALKTANKLYSIPYLTILTQKDNKLKVSLTIVSLMMEVSNKIGN